MDNQLTNIGIVRESRNDENRTPLVPEHIKKYKENVEKVLTAGGGDLLVVGGSADLAGRRRLTAA